MRTTPMAEVVKALSRTTGVTTPTPSPMKKTAAPRPSRTVEEPQTSPRADKSERATRDAHLRVNEVAETFEEAQEGIAHEPDYRRDDPKWSRQTAKLEENAQFGRLNEAYLRTALAPPVGG